MSSSEPPPLRWWGWGERDVQPSPGLMHLLADEIGIPGDVVMRAPAMHDVQLPEANLPDRLRRRLAAAVGSAHVARDREARIRHAAGRSYLDLLALRSGAVSEAPDAVVTPATSAEVLRVLRLCGEEGCAVVPYGGGTSVVGGVAPLRGPFDSVITLDLARVSGVSDIDAYSQLATLHAGTRGPLIEAALAASDLTLGHFPQSYEYATVGGFAATRSAGQASSGYGRFDELVRGCDLVAPAGEMRLRANPPDAAGPSLLQVVLGSEGTCGVVTSVTVRVRPRARFKHHAGWSFPDLPSGVDALRELAQHHQLPDVTRLSDPEETRITLAAAGNSRATRAARAYLRLRGHASGCLAILGWEGDAAAVGSRERRAQRVLRRHGAVALGAAPGRAWLRSRFDGPYLRDSLLDRAVLVETLETAATWARLLDVRTAVERALLDALSEADHSPLIGCHVSHVYPEGASLYFTVLARQASSDQRVQWLQAKRAATDAMLTAGGVLTHHHAVGTDHSPWMQRVVGSTGITALTGVRGSLDSAGIMNPGKLTRAAAPGKAQP